MRTEQRWTGLASGVLSRAIRFLTGLAIITLCLREYGAEAWSVAAVVLASVDLLSYLDFAGAELAQYEAARASSPAELKQKTGQTSWLLLPPLVLGTGTLILASTLLEGLGLEVSSARTGALSGLLAASACGYPFTLLANVYGGVLQGLGQLRAMNSLQAFAGLLELALVVCAVLAGASLISVQWWRALAQLIRWLCFAVMLRRLDIALPYPARPVPDTLRQMARFCLGTSVTKVLGGAIYRSPLPIAQGFASPLALGAYDVVDRLGGVLQRAANPVWDSLFPRLVRSFGRSGIDDQRAAGARDFMAGTLLLSSLAACATTSIVNLAPWLFPLWLGAKLSPEPIAFAPWVLATWSLNLSSSMCTAVLIAATRFGASNVLHAAALLLNIVAIVGLGRGDGTLGLLAGPLLANGMLAVGLSIFGCRTAGVRLHTYASALFTLWLPGLVAIAVARWFNSLLVAIAATSLGVLGVLLALWRARSVRSLRAEFAARS